MLEAQSSQSTQTSFAWSSLLVKDPYTTRNRARTGVKASKYKECEFVRLPSDPTRAFRHSHSQAESLRWKLLCDVFGFRGEDEAHGRIGYTFCILLRFARALVGGIAESFETWDMWKEVSKI